MTSPSPGSMTSSGLLAIGGVSTGTAWANSRRGPARFWPAVAVAVGLALLIGVSAQQYPAIRSAGAASTATLAAAAAATAASPLALVFLALAAVCSFGAAILFASGGWLSAVAFCLPFIPLAYLVALSSTWQAALASAGFFLCACL